MSKLYSEIGLRVIKERQRLGYKQQDVIADRTLMASIEKGVIKSGNNTFIPNRRIQDIAEMLDMTPKRLVFGDDDDVAQYVKWIYEVLAYNIPGIEVFNNQFIYNGKHLAITKKLQRGFNQWAEYSLADGIAREAMNTWWLDEVGYDLYHKIVENFWKQNDQTIIDSFENQFVSENITLKKYSERIDQWIDADFNQIVDNAIRIGHQHEIYQIGYYVAEQMNHVTEWSFRFDNPYEFSDIGEPALMTTHHNNIKDVKDLDFILSTYQKSKYSDAFSNLSKAAMAYAEQLTANQKMVFVKENTEIL